MGRKSLEQLAREAEANHISDHQCKECGGDHDILLGFGIYFNPAYGNSAQEAMDNDAFYCQKHFKIQEDAYKQGKNT